MDAAVNQGFFGAHWGPLTEQLDALYRARGDDAVEAQRMCLQQTLIAVFASLGLQVRRAEDVSLAVPTLGDGALLRNNFV